MMESSSKKLGKGDRSTQEQLRVDHIETLEVLNQTTKENEALKLKLITLERRLRDAGLSLDCEEEAGLNQAEEPPANNKELSYTDLMLQNREQAKEIQQLKDKMRQTSLEDQKRFNDIQMRQLMEFSQQLMKSQQKEKDTQSQNKMLEEQLSMMRSTNTHLSALQTELLSLRETLAVKEEELHATSQELQAAQVAVEESRSDNETKQQKLLEITAELEQMYIVVGELRQSNTALDETNQEQTHNIQFLETELENLRKVVLLASKGVVFADSDDEYDHNSTAIQADVVLQDHLVDATCQTSPLPSPVAAKPWPSILPPQVIIPQTSTIMHEPEDKDDETPGNFRFQDFIRLKRENRELKLRLADLTSSASPLTSLLGGNHKTAMANSKSSPVFPLAPIQAPNSKYVKAVQPAGKLPQLRKF